MRARQFIIEYDRAKTARAFTAKLVNQTLKDPTAPAAVKQTIKDIEPQQAAEMILQKQIEPGDPTKQKKFAQALALKYANGLIKWEDVTSTLTDYLAKFFKLGLKKKLKPEHSDFNRYKDLKTFYDAVDTYPDPDENSEVKGKGESKEVFDNEEMRIIVPKDEAAACYYGQGTRWCTAAKNDNMFNMYNNEGPLYIILPKNPRYTGEKYQLHSDSDGYVQIMDEKDENVTPGELFDRFSDKEFKDLVLKIAPKIKNNISDYPDDEELVRIWKELGALIQDKDIIDSTADEIRHLANVVQRTPEAQLHSQYMGMLPLVYDWALKIKNRVGEEEYDKETPVWSSASVEYNEKKDKWEVVRMRDKEDA